LKLSQEQYRVWGSGAATAAFFVLMAGAGPASAGDEAAKLLEAEHQVTRILSEAGDPAFGAYLGGECAICHQQSGNSDGIPPIAGLPVDYTVQALVRMKLCS
jgi:cytochrome c553